MPNPNVFVTSRSFALPSTDKLLTDPIWYNMFEKRQLPYRLLQVGDILYWFDTKQAAIVWKTRVRAVERFQYDSKEAVRKQVADPAFRDRFGVPDLDHPYFTGSKANKGFFLAYIVDSASPVRVPRPVGYKFKRIGWLDLSSDEAPDEWRTQLLLQDEPSIAALELQPPPLVSDIAEPAQRQELVVYRILRDTALARRVKALHNNECQICGHTIVLINGLRYSEAHHIRPLGDPHNGPDVIDNILCVCPNHHAELDYGVRPLSLVELRTALGHSIREEYVRYHNDVIHRNAQ
jgi:hypothetical protein